MEQINQSLLHKVVDKITGAIWLSKKSHNAKLWNNHQIVRFIADMMAKAQAKYGISVMTIDACAYVCALVNADLKTQYSPSDFMAPNPVKETPQIQAVATPQIQAVAPQIAVADESFQYDVDMLDWITAQRTTAMRNELLLKLVDYGHNSGIVEKHLQKAYDKQDKPKLPPLPRF